jgi:hypothetical protein
MEIFVPSPSILNEFNRVLISLDELTIIEKYCLKDSLIRHCTSLTFRGNIVNYEDVIDICNELKIIQLRGDEVTISSLGNKLLSANREKYYEITEAQKVFIADKMVFKGVLVNHARDIFKLFEPNFDAGTYQYSLSENPLPKKHEQTLQLFKFLKIILENSEMLTVSKEYVESVYSITADGKALSEQQLEQILIENRKLGSQGEIAVVAFEKRRLQSLGKIIQAELVQRISTINTAAGYDIESFNGDSDTLTPDRLIEVKASHSSDLKFYWSSNEKNVALQNRKNYWIYFLGDFNDEKSNIKPIMIKDPYYTIFEEDGFSKEAKNYLIIEIANKIPSTESIGEVVWLQY